MNHAALALILVAFACAASSEPRTRDVVQSAPVGTPPPADAAPAEAARIDAPVAPEVVSADAAPGPVGAPMTPQRVYPVVQLRWEGTFTRVAIGAGKRMGLNKQWKAYLVDKDERPVRGGELTITLVEQGQTFATTKLRVEYIPDGVQAHLDPP